MISNIMSDIIECVVCGDELSYKDMIEFNDKHEYICECCDEEMKKNKKNKKKRKKEREFPKLTVFDVKLDKHTKYPYLVELAKELPMYVTTDKIRARDVDEIAEWCKMLFDTQELAVEKLWLVCFDMDRLKGFFELSSGTLKRAEFDPMACIRAAIFTGSTDIVLIHNHPSGNADPTPHDVMATVLVQQLCKLHNLNLADHLIISDTRYSSMRKTGVLEDEEVI